MPKVPTDEQPRRRGRRPRPDQTQRTEGLILEAAAGLFLERGFAETRMDEIARRADVAKGTLYLYFPTKAAMFEAVLRRVVAGPLMSITTIAVAEGETVRHFLRRALAPILRDNKGRRREDMVRLIVSEGARFPEVAEIYRRVALDPITEFLRGLAERARAGGELRSGTDGLSRFPLLLMTPVLMATVWNGLHPLDDQVNPVEAFESLLDLIFTDDQQG